MPQPRSLSHSRPIAPFRSNRVGLLGIRNGQIWTPWSRGGALLGETLPTGATIWMTQDTLGTANAALAFVERLEWPNPTATIRLIVTATSGAAPNVYYCLNDGVETIGTGVNIPVKGGDCIRIGIRPTAGATGIGTVTVQNRPEMGSRSYSYGVL